MNTVSISGRFRALAGGHLNLQTQTEVISVQISDDGVGLFFSKNPNGSLKLEAAPAA
jgi:hypothetical protein